MKKYLFLLLFVMGTVQVSAQKTHLWTTLVSLEGNSMMYFLDLGNKIKPKGDYEISPMGLSIVYMYKLPEIDISYSVSSYGTWKQNGNTVKIVFDGEPEISLGEYHLKNKELENKLKNDKEAEDLWFETLLDSLREGIMANINLFKEFKIVEFSSKEMTLSLGGGYFVFKRNF